MLSLLSSVCLFVCLNTLRSVASLLLFEVTVRPQFELGLSALKGNGGRQFLDLNAPSIAQPVCVCVCV